MSTDQTFVAEHLPLIHKLTQLIASCDATCLKALPRMSIHEFVTIVNFYCHNPDVLVSKALMMSVFAKVQDSAQEFNELQLVILRTGIEKLFQAERAKFSDDSDFESKLFQGDRETLEMIDSAY